MATIVLPSRPLLPPEVIQTLYNGRISVDSLSNCYFFWLPSPEYAIERVAQRVREGGHNIPNDVIVRRYFAGIRNLFDIYMPIVDSWMIIDNSVNPRFTIAEKIESAISVYDETSYSKIKNYEQTR